MKPTLAIDVGATTTRVATVDDPGRIGAIRRFATPESSAALVDLIATAAGRLRTDSAMGCDSFDAVCMAVPGILSPDTKTVARSVHASWLEGAPLSATLEQRLGAPVRLATDAAAATFGEYSQIQDAGAAFAHLRLGTGVAFGLIVDGQWQTLPRPDLGHLTCLRLPADLLDMPCTCGQRGCLEAVASGAALERAACVGLVALQARVDRGDAAAAAILRAAGDAVLHVAAGIVRRWGVEAFVIGGGVCAGLPCLAEMLLRDGAGEPKLPLQAARLGDDAGVIGVAMACGPERSGV
ncbi:MAG: ROK family protein [Phycisphaerae bacterium]